MPPPLRQGEVTILLQEFPGPFDATGDDVLVRRQPGGGLELPGEVVRTEARDRSHLIQGRGPESGEEEESAIEAAKKTADEQAPDEASANESDVVKLVPEQVRFHDLRHTVASLLLSKGHSLKAVSQRLGHANPMMRSWLKA